MDNLAVRKIIAGPWRRKATHGLNCSSVKDLGAFGANNPGQFQLADRLFAENERRMETVDRKEVRDHEIEIASTGAFINRTVLMFAEPSSHQNDIAHWLETLFDLYVMKSQSHTYFYEWLFRYAGTADLILIDQDSFGDHNSSFNRFVRIAREACDSVPLVVISKGFCVDDFSVCWSDAWDVSLRSPVSISSLCKAVGTACEISLNGR